MSRTEKILKGIAASQRVAGAYLFIGPPGVGKRQAAEFFADQLKCRKPDRILVEPSGATLKIEQVRDLQRVVRYGPSMSQYQLVVVDQADTLTDQAAAAFLKTLEEPAAGVVFILLVERTDRLPKTIVSRCQKIVFAETALDWAADPELSQFYAEIKGLKTMARAEQLGVAARLAKEKDRIEELLYALLLFARYELFDARMARIMLDTVRFIKRRVNLKIALDVMCLKLGEVNAR